MFCAVVTPVLVFVGASPALAETIDERVVREVTLDASGGDSVDQFDPSLGTLTQIAVTIDVSVLVQACVENRDDAAASSGGSISGSLAVAVAGVAGETVAAAVADLPTSAVSAGDGSDDCDEGLDDDTARFSVPVVATDVAYAEQGDEATAASTLTSAAELAPFIGSGTVAIAHTPDSDTSYAVPIGWDSVAVAVGSYEVEVVYTYTPTPTPPGGPVVRTGSSAATEVAVAMGFIAVGAATLVLARRRRAAS